MRGFKGLLQETSGISLYSQLEYLLINMIEENKIPEGEEFFSEQEISDLLGISRPTVNKAMKSLIDKGYLYRERGKRAIIKNPLDLPLLFISEILSFGNMLDRLGISYSTKLLKREVLPANSAQRKQLELPEDAQVIKLSRLRSVKDEPILVVDSWLDYQRFHKLMEVPEERFSNNLFQVFEEDYQIKIKFSEREVVAARTSLDDAKLLNTSLWEPCLVLKAVNFDENRRPIEIFHSRLKGNKCVLKTSLELK